MCVFQCTTLARVGDWDLLGSSAVCGAVSVASVFCLFLCMSYLGWHPPANTRCVRVWALCVFSVCCVSLLRMLGVGCWVLGVGCWVLGVGCWVWVCGTAPCMHHAPCTMHHAGHGAPPATWLRTSAVPRPCGCSGRWRVPPRPTPKSATTSIIAATTATGATARVDVVPDRQHDHREYVSS